jgi:uncharacterized protein (DUF433 family)
MDSNNYQTALTAIAMIHISLDEHGVAYVGGTMLKVADVAIALERWGMTAREVQENYPRLTLAQVHAALAYYYDHKAEIDAQTAREEIEVARLRADNPNPLSRAQFEERLRARRREDHTAAS